MSMLIVTQPDQIAGIFTTGNARNIEWAEKKNQIFASFLKPSSIYIKIITHLALLNVQEFLQVKCHKKTNEWMNEYKNYHNLMVYNENLDDQSCDTRNGMTMDMNSS